MEERNAFVFIAELHRRRGVSQLKDLPGCWEVQVDAGWWFALNGHAHPVRCSKGADVPPYNAYVMFGDIPAGFIDPYGGVFVGADDSAYEEFCAAVAAATG